MTMENDEGQIETQYASMPEAAPDDSVISGGEPLAEGIEPASESVVIEALRTVHDPEIPVNLYDLGLIYALDISDLGDVAIEMTLTTPACPVAGSMPGEVVQAVAQAEGVGRVDVKLVWDPPWTMERMSEDARLALGMG